MIDALARFQRTEVMTEWPADLTAERYPKFLAGTLPPAVTKSFHSDSDSLKAPA